MGVRNLSLCFATIVLLSVASGDAAESRLRIDVSPRISTAPAAVRVRAMVTPNATNRALKIVADSGSFYRSSMVSLDGANAAAITETVFKNLPGGDYDVTVVLVDANGGSTMDRREITVTASLLD